MKYLDVCTGISAATVAWHSLGWQAVAFAEIDKFPSAVLAHHYPETRNLGDFTKIQANDVGPIDLLVGGTPCQDFSIAGLRAGVAGERGNLTLEFLRLAQRLRPRWLVWENVPGVYSATSNDGPDHSHDGDGRWQDDANESHAFACFLAGLQELGYGFAYRTLDARYFGVPQRRERVFVVGHLGDWRRAAAVLFERSCLSGDTPPRRETREDLAPTLSARTHGSGGLGTDFDCDGGLIAFGGNNTSGPIDVATACNAHGGSGRMDFDSETLVTSTLDASYGRLQGCSGQDANHGYAFLTVTAPLTQNPYADNESRESLQVTHALRADGFDVGEDGTGRGTPLVPVAFDCKASGRNGFGVGDISPTLRSMGHKDTHQNAGGQVAVMTLAIRGRDGEPTLEIREDGTANAVLTPNGGRGGIGVGAVAIQERAICENPDAGPDGVGVRDDDTSYSLEARTVPQAVMTPTMAVRRLTPRECERLQGFPDDYTKISAKTDDGPRYKALGNSMAVPVMRWIGERISVVESITERPKK
jgi:DNA (cytosine-5)-methyltransferase 1